MFDLISQFSYLRKSKLFFQILFLFAPVGRAGGRWPLERWAHLHLYTKLRTLGLAALRAPIARKVHEVRG